MYCIILVGSPSLSVPGLNFQQENLVGNMLIRSFHHIKGNWYLRNAYGHLAFSALTNP